MNIKRKLFFSLNLGLYLLCINNAYSQSSVSSSAEVLATPNSNQIQTTVSDVDLYTLNTDKYEAEITTMGGCLGKVKLKEHKKYVTRDEYADLSNSIRWCKFFNIKINDDNFETINATVKKISDTKYELKQIDNNKYYEITKIYDFNNTNMSKLDITIKNISEKELSSTLYLETGVTSDNNISFFQFLPDFFYTVKEHFIKNNEPYVIKRMVNQHFAFYSNDKVHTYSLPYDDSLEYKTIYRESNQAVSWFSSGNMYFTAILIPKYNEPVSFLVEKMNYNYEMNKKVKNIITGKFDDTGEKIIQPAYNAYVGHSFNIKPNQIKTWSYDLYIGDNSTTKLAEYADKKIDNSVDYGFFNLIARPLYLLLAFIYKFIGNWGFAIIVLTAIVRMVIYPLAKKSYIATRKQTKIQPQIQEIREKYKDDKLKQNQEVMALMAREKANPLSGCLPMLPQIPIFFGLYQVFQQTFELRHAKFIFWINDLSSVDQYFLLTAILFVLYWLQQKIMPMVTSGMDPAQAKMLKYMPYFFALITIALPSGIAIYMITNTALTIIQQKYLIQKYKDV